MIQKGYRIKDLPWGFSFHFYEWDAFKSLYMELSLMNICCRLLQYIHLCFVSNRHFSDLILHFPLYILQIK